MLFPVNHLHHKRLWMIHVIKIWSTWWQGNLFQGKRKMTFFLIWNKQTINLACVTCRYPSLRVAYVEEKEKIVQGRTHKVYSSKLVKVVNGFEQVFFNIMKKTSLRNIGKDCTYKPVELFNRSQCLLNSSSISCKRY